MAEEREITIADPFAVLGVADDAGDEAIRRRYLALVRQFSPDREAERFQSYRQAYEAIRGPRERMQVRLLHASNGALLRLKRHCLPPEAGPAGRVSASLVAALIVEGLKRASWD